MPPHMYCFLLWLCLLLKKEAAGLAPFLCPWNLYQQQQFISPAVCLALCNELRGLKMKAWFPANELTHSREIMNTCGVLRL